MFLRMWMFHVRLQDQVDCLLLLFFFRPFLSPYLIFWTYLNINSSCLFFVKTLQLIYCSQSSSFIAVRRRSSFIVGMSHLTMMTRNQKKKEMNFHHFFSSISVNFDFFFSFLITDHLGPDRSTEIAWRAARDWAPCPRGDPRHGLPARTWDTPEISKPQGTNMNTFQLFSHSQMHGPIDQNHLPFSRRMHAQSWSRGRDRKSSNPKECICAIYAFEGSWNLII